jgi:16S rRNA U516 pseudouridylate synthase RsuA-like enzyme
MNKLRPISIPQEYVYIRRNAEGKTIIYSFLSETLSTMFDHVMSIDRFAYNSEGLLTLTNNTLKEIFESSSKIKMSDSTG